MIAIEVEAVAWREAVADVEDIVHRAAAAALTAGGASTGDLSILLTDDSVVQGLNAQFRDQDRPTNVLSFPAAATARPHLGDVALAYGVCAGESRAQGKPLTHHLAHLVAHGVLHLVGYDHQADAEAQAMEDMERGVLRGLGVPDPYAASKADVEPPLQRS